MHKRMSVVVALVGLGLSCAAWAQQTTPAAPMSPIKRTILQKFDVPGTNYETVTVLAEILPNVSAGRHTHPGPETGYLLEGEVTVLVEGKAPQTLKPGDSYYVTPVTVHDARSGDKGAKYFAVYTVEKGKPLATPAP
jgi:quercetin dioxygenase-like cupin family protein